MASVTRADCVSAAHAAGASWQDANDIVDRLMRQKAVVRQQGMTNPSDLTNAWAAHMQGLRTRAARQRRLADIAIMRRVELEREIDAGMASGRSFRDVIMGVLLGTTERVEGARRSVATQRRGKGSPGHISGGFWAHLGVFPAAPVVLKLNDVGRLYFCGESLPGEDSGANPIVNILETMRMLPKNLFLHIIY